MAKSKSKSKSKSKNLRVRFRDEKGRFTTNVFKEQVIRNLAATKGIDNLEKHGKVERRKGLDQMITEAGITEKELKLFYELNKETFIDSLHSEYTQDLSRNYNQTINDLDKYKGEVLLNGEKVSKHEAKMFVENFKQMLSTEINAVDFTIKPKYFYDGRLEINLPDSNELIEQLLEYFGVDDIEDLNEMTGEEIAQALKEIIDDDNLTIYVS